MSISLLSFCFRSLCREYGAAFLLRVLLAHPVAAARGIARYASATTSPSAPWPGGAQSLVGAGFCLKPLSPPCPSGRANHRCQVLDLQSTPSGEPCKACQILRIARQAQSAHSAFYIMTSARDILHDLLLPALRRRYRAALLVMCAYSFEPVRLACAICGIEPTLFPFHEGDCRNYTDWRRADIGDKPDQTLLARLTQEALDSLLTMAARPAPAQRFERAGNIYVPLSL